MLNFAVEKVKATLLEFILRALNFMLNHQIPWNKLILKML